MERIVVALGGNALLQRGEEDDIEHMRRSARFAAQQIAEIAARGWQVVVTHGNGPQVGRILLQNEAARDFVHPMPLDVCGAESQGQIGYLLQVTIGDVFYERNMEKPVVTVLTLTRVPPDDPAFQHQLVEGGAVVIAAGGGGVPVMEEGPKLVGREAVVDKDLAASILARDVAAETLLILTDVGGVYADHGTKGERLLERLTPAEARQMLADGALGEGSMGPKVEAAAEFVEAGGKRAVIASLGDAVAAADGRAGTTIAH